MWEAIGTIFAAIVALSFGLYSIIRGWMNRPILTFQKFDKNQHVEVDNTGKILFLYLFNKGKTTAKEIHIKFDKITQQGKEVQ